MTNIATTPVPVVTVFAHKGGRTYSQPGRPSFAVADALPSGQYMVRPIDMVTGPVVADADRADMIAARWAAEGIPA